MFRVLNPVSEQGSTRESGGERASECVHMLVCVLHDQHAMLTSVRVKGLGFRISRSTRGNKVTNQSTEAFTLFDITNNNNNGRGSWTFGIGEYTERRQHANLCLAPLAVADPRSSPLTSSLAFICPHTPAHEIPAPAMNLPA